jgi:hypothetical protein
MENCLQSQTDAPIFLAVIGPGASSTTRGPLMDHILELELVPHDQTMQNAYV